MQTQQVTPRMTFVNLLERNKPQAVAWVSGLSGSTLSGMVKFYATPFQGVLVEAEIFNLPDANMAGNFYALHIHEHGDCSDSFMKAGGHYNPAGQPHPEHAGDMIPILGNQGYAWMSFYTKRFSIKDIIGRSVIIHAKPDDFTTQPSGNAGQMIGCGVIQSDSTF